MNEMDRALEVRTGRVWRDGEGIIHVAISPNVAMTLEDAHEQMRAVATLCEGARRPTLIDLGRMKTMERGARQYFAGPECAKYESAAALVVLSPLAKALGNFFMGLNKPLMPTRLFNDERSAMEWLRGFS